MLIFLLSRIENIIIIRYYEKKNMRVASLAHTIFSIVYGLYIFYSDVLFKHVINSF